MFSEQQTKHRTFFKTPLKAFRLVGINPLAEDYRDIITQPIICYGLYVLAFIFTLASMDFCLKNIHNVNDFTVVLSVLNQLVIALWKIAIFFGKRQRIHKLIKDIWQWNETVYSTGTIGLLLPLIIKLFKIFQGQEAVLEVPHNSSYFWNTSNFVGYTAAYIWDVFSVHFLINASVAIDTLFLWLVSNILIRFSILKKRLENAALKTSQQLFRDLIKNTVQFHLKILYLAKELDSIFAEIIFIKSLISCTQICLIAFSLTSQKTSAVNLLHPFIFLMAVSMQLFLYCYNGHLIEEQSLLVSSNVFAAFDWSRIPASNQKMLQMLMLRSQKTSHITGLFFNLNLSLYLWFFKTAGSLIAVLQTLDDNTKHNGQ